MENYDEAKKKRVSGGLIVAITILSILLVAFIVLYSLSMSRQNQLKVDLENIYQRNFNELVDNVNNSDIKLSKVLASDYNSYAKKMLNEISKNTAEASTNLSALPVSINGIDDTIKFINQVSGYTQSLAEKLEEGEELSQTDIDTLQKLKGAFTELKNNVNELSKNIYSGNIYDESNKLEGDYNKFTISLQSVKSGDVDYPTMIYDGPFSDSTVNKKIKNMNFAKVSVNVAEDKIKDIFKNIPNKNVDYLGETNGKFETYDYKLTTNENNVIYVQVTKNGAKLLTMSCNDTNSNQNYTLKEAVATAINFTKSLGIENMQCVWSDIVSSDAYLNLAPVKDNIILYPDLIKVKVDLATGMVIGYEASSYYINHIERDLQSAKITAQDANNKVPSDYQISETRLVLAPLQYQKEVLCYEVICNKDNETYYIYINAISGEMENILKTIETDNGNLLL